MWTNVICSKRGKWHHGRHLLNTIRSSTRQKNQLQWKAADHPNSPVVDIMQFGWDMQKGNKEDDDAVRFQWPQAPLSNPPPPHHTPALPRHTPALVSWMSSAAIAKRNGPMHYQVKLHVQSSWSGLNVILLLPELWGTMFENYRIHSERCGFKVGDRIWFIAGQRKW